MYKGGVKWERKKITKYLNFLDLILLFSYSLKI